MKPIAIIGMSAIFPQAENIQEYWDNILNEVDCITDVPPSRWEIADYYDPNPKAPDKSYSKRGGFIPDIDFDPFEFGLPPNLLEVTDVSQLLALVAAKACLEDGGYGESAKVSRENVGVILGMVGVGSKLMIPLTARLQYPIWDKVLKSYGINAIDRHKIIEKIKLAYPEWEENSFPGAIGNVVAGRIANRFDLGGTNCVIDAACASSLAAIRMAVMELSEGHADMMISGGVDTDNSIGAYLCFSKTPAFTQGEKVRPFDKDSDGMLVGEGIGMVLLKRLEDAERDGDRVYAVIKGVGSSSDGRHKSIYAPRPDGQTLALQRAYTKAKFSPSTVELIEAHGTGTMAGDPAEFEGLNTAFSINNDKKQLIALGSVKSQIGHTKAAAGVASLIKTALALHNKILPPTININQPNPKLKIDHSPFYLNTETRPWFDPLNHPRRAGVSSFGFGGTNFHVVLEENNSEHTIPYRTHTTAKMVLISAPNPESLAEECNAWAERLNETHSIQVLNELVTQSRMSNISEAYARVGFVAVDCAEAQKKLETAIALINLQGAEKHTEHPSGVYYQKKGIHPKGKVVALFPGQGSQYTNMGSHIAMNFPEMRQAFARMDSLFLEDEKPPLSKTVYPVPVFNPSLRDAQDQKLTATKYAQPAIGTLSMGFYKILENAGFKPDFLAGHSYGELSALWAANVIDDNEFLFLSKSRGEAMSPLSDPDFDAGTMLAVKGDIEKLKTDIASYPEITLANWNSNDQVVLAGSKSAIAEIKTVLASNGYGVIPLDVSAAFHTPLVGHAQKPFAAAIKQVKFKKPKTLVYSNSTGKKYPSDPAEIKRILEGHILNAVHFKDEIEAIHAAGGSIFIEIGPKRVLTNLVKNILKDKFHISVALNPNAKQSSDRQLREAVTKMCVVGLPLQNIDPYNLIQVPQAPKKLSPVSVKLNGGLFLSDKTKVAFQNAVNQDNTLDCLVKPGTTPKTQVTHAPDTEHVLSRNLTNHESTELSPATSSVEIIQQDTLTIHQQFLENNIEYARIFSQLTQQELELLNGKSSQADLSHINQALQTLDRSISQFHKHHAQTLKIHEQYLRNQSDLIDILIHSPQPDSVSTLPKNTDGKNNVSISKDTTTPDQEANSKSLQNTQPGEYRHNPAKQGTTPIPDLRNESTAMQNIDVQSLNLTLLEIVSEKTGYPTEMLEMEMDMEADLGIDSIKRVEILGAMQTSYPDLPPADPTVLSEMRTLGEIVEYMAHSAAGFADGSQTLNQKDTQKESPPETQDVQIENTSAMAPIEEIQAVLLDIVSNKTGYPPEMLEMEMDMEADLGIDSIKRVEILGAMEERFPELPQTDPTILAELRTLAEIKALMSSNLKSELAPSNNLAKNSGDDVEEFDPNKQTTNLAIPTQDLEEMTQSLLEIVSEKTGYPPEMLDMGMDFEADLGIDSIKRVEILGAMEEKYPDLPVIDTSLLAELHTLEQIITTLSTPTAPGPQPANLIRQAEEKQTLPPHGVITLQPLPLPDRLIIKPQADVITLMIDDGSLLTTKLVEKLNKLNNKVVVLSLPENLVPKNPSLPNSVERIKLEGVSDAIIQSTLKKVGKVFGPIGIFIHLNPLSNGSKPFSEVENSIIKTIFLTAKHLKNPLTQAGEHGYAAFITATRMDGQFGLSKNSQVEPVSGGFFGLTKSLNLEWENVFCRAIDLDPALDPETASAYIETELFDPNQYISEVAYNKDGRFTLAIQKPESKTNL